MIQDVVTHRLPNTDYLSTNLLNRVLAIASSTLPIRTMLSSICEELAHTTGALRSAFALVDPQNTRLDIFADYPSNGQSSDRVEPLRIENNRLFNKLIDDRVPILIESDPFEPSTILLRDFLKVRISEKLLVIPLFIRGQCQGLFGIVLENLQEFTSEEISLALGVTRVASLVIEKEQLGELTNSQQTERQQLESELCARLDIEKLIQQTSIRLIQLTSEKIDLGIQEVLETLGGIRSSRPMLYLQD